VVTTKNQVESFTRAPQCWHIITSEYPPQAGGVSDYAHGVAVGLVAEGDEVHVWCPGSPSVQEHTEGVAVHTELGTFGPADLRRVEKQLDRFPGPRRLLVQWVPHGYGYKSMNVRFCYWLWSRATRHGDRVDIMVHEAYLSFRATSLRQSAVALVHRFMTLILLRATRRVWMSIPAWERCWRPYALRRRIRYEWLPVPSNIPITEDPSGIQTVRRRYVAEGGTLIGHFGTFGWPITSLLRPILMGLLRDAAEQSVLLMGIGSERFREELVRTDQRLAKFVFAAGALSAEELSCHVAACDVMIQPFPDGVSSRRGSFMVGLCHGKPIVTTIGHLSEPFWKGTGALALAPVQDPGRFVELVNMLRADAGERARMGQAARTIYQERFDISHTIATLRNAASNAEYPACVS
jgi:glycosyltransferase involved in cell wall biosynthesis